MPNDTNYELFKLIKKANQRILRIERETGQKESFATKQLIDYLSSNPIDAITKQGRIKRKEYTDMQKIAIEKAIKDFEKQTTSSIKGLKQYKEYVSNVLGKKITYKQADVFYQATSQLNWLYDKGITYSEYQNVIKPKAKTMDKESWIDMVAMHMSELPDRNIVTKLEMLYDYLKNG